MIRPLRLIASSHLLTVVALLTAVALAASRGLWRELPGLYLLAAAAVTGVIFTSPGTILTSQIMDAYAAAIVVLTIATARGGSQLRVAGSTVLVGLGLWTAAQNGVRIARIAQQHVPSAAADRRRLVDAVRLPRLVAESAMILSWRTAAVLDPLPSTPGLNGEVARTLERIARRASGSCSSRSDQRQGPRLPEREPLGSRVRRSSITTRSIASSRASSYRTLR